MIAKKGDIVKCVFLDHCENSDDPIEFILYGRLIQKTRAKLVIDCWEYADIEEKHDENEQRFTIVRSAVSELTKLVEI